MLSSDGLGNQIVGLQSRLPHGPSWVAFGGKLGKGAEEKDGQGGEVTGTDPGESFFNSSGRRL